MTHPAGSPAAAGHSELTLCGRERGRTRYLLSPVSLEGAGRHRWPPGRAWRALQPQAGDAATGLSGQRAGDLQDGGLATGGIVAELLDGEQAPCGVQARIMIGSSIWQLWKSASVNRKFRRGLSTKPITSSNVVLVVSPGPARQTERFSGRTQSASLMPRKLRTITFRTCLR